ncbi:MAG TPA: TetR family transcriptional regulator [Acidimicrobiales bacterium]|nr:TetR family transcriptional regulator [Acidimicrobiales bacterium]
MVAEGVRDGRLTEGAVVDATLRLIEADGVDRLSMRRLAEELAVTPMAIYYYVRSKEELLTLVADRVLGQIGWKETGTWQERILIHATRVWEVLTQYPGLALFLLNRPMSEESLRGVSRVRALFGEAGFDPDTAELAFQSYHAYSYGLIAMDTQFHLNQRSQAARRRAVVFGFQTWLAGLEVQLGRVKEAGGPEAAEPDRSDGPDRTGGSVTRETSLTIPR